MHRQNVYKATHICIGYSAIDPYKNWIFYDKKKVNNQAALVYLQKGLPQSIKWVKACEGERGDKVILTVL
jgi:hypothetical protein